MRIVVALGGNALLKRGQRMSAEIQRDNIRIAAAQLGKIGPAYNLVITHGNGPQVGWLALQGANTPQTDPLPLDVLDAETEGMIGYLIEQELSNALPGQCPLATLLTMVEVDPADPALTLPTKPVGLVYSRAEADKLVQTRGWTMALDGNMYRRVVPSPVPQRIVEMRPLRWLLEKGVTVICAGGGGIPVIIGESGQCRGIEAVIDKDRCAALLAREVDAHLLIIVTDVPAVFVDWDRPECRPICRASPDALAAFNFAAGSMGPKVEAACDFVRHTGRRAVIGALADIEQLIDGTKGTCITADQADIVFGSA